MRIRLSILFLLLLLLTSCHKVDNDIDTYYNTGTCLDNQSEYFMPKIDDLGAYKDIDFAYTQDHVIIFQSDSVVLNVEYEKEAYMAQKEMLIDKYDYFDNTNLTEDDSIDSIIPNTFSIGSYDFKIVKKPDDDTSGLPKQCAMVGTSDDLNKIAYLFFYDFDVDILSYEDENTVMQEFVEEYFDYEFE